ncbi:lipid asymmetry maintenance protein MlaB [Methyloversatilis sp. XJ19-49]|uniref:STAS domain-containing protein n=1 Tax=Methyloversatilis sp. XJ19-49 TaxID=2963429 RepID=UPI00211C7953|nr:STAS domain-containing protein [Methyloversatilis sp. XJ19-49]MCQ9379127.1 STAS domain-containing protein [Methyloversatilis sp. XJ19-49]
MEIERTDDGGVTELKVAGELTIFGAADAYGILTRALSEERDLRINLAQVTEVDSSGVQVLLAAKRAAEAHGHGFELVAHSAAMLEVMELLQLSHVFGDPVVMPAQPA